MMLLAEPAPEELVEALEQALFRVHTVDPQVRAPAFVWVFVGHALLAMRGPRARACRLRVFAF